MKLKIENNNQEYEIEPNSELSKALDAKNSPLLFGCRTGICGTCLVEVIEGEAHDFKPNPDELDLLEIIAENNPKARLACQMRIKNDLHLKYIGKK